MPSINTVWPLSSFSLKVIILLATVTVVASTHDEPPTPANKLYAKLLGPQSTYNKLIRPVGNATDALIVKIRLRLTSIIDIDEKNQIMTTNVWLEQHWFDLRLMVGYVAYNWWITIIECVN